MPLEAAGQAEILRSVQKDQSFLDLFKRNVADILQKSLGTQLWLKYHKWINTCCEVIYYSLTTLALRQTLGEEYTGLLMLNRTRSLPSTLNRIMMVILQCLGPTIIRLLIKKLDQSLTSGFLSTYLKPSLRNAALNQMPILKAFPSFFLKVHLSTFYLVGTFYHLAKRITGIRYVLLRSWFQDRSTGNSFKILGSVLTVNLLVGLLYSIYDFKKKKIESAQKKKNTLVPGDKQCPLCLDKRKHSSVTPCGHLFCWTCIHECLQTSDVCPICRHPCVSNRIVPLMNYD